MGHVQTMYKFPSLTTEVCINILSIQHIPGSSYDPGDDNVFEYVIYVFKICIMKNLNTVLFL